MILPGTAAPQCGKPEIVTVPGTETAPGPTRLFKIIIAMIARKLDCTKVGLPT
ncbi:MAG: hypothetical protein NTV33_06710 [Coprothermobacterota bacterium]|nr:hypothetical protein [Coprothermobacterota bacterium]